MYLKYFVFIYLNIYSTIFDVYIYIYITNINILYLKRYQAKNCKAKKIKQYIQSNFLFYFPKKGCNKGKENNKQRKLLDIVEQSSKIHRDPKIPFSSLRHIYIYI